MLATDQQRIREDFISLGKAVEIEAKFGSYQNGSFTSSVSFIHYDRLYGYLSNSPLIGRIQREESTVYINNNVRKITIAPQGDNPETIIWQQKTRVSHFDLYEYDIRVSVNKELDISPIPNYESAYTRERTRTSFFHNNDSIRIDLTEVMPHGRGISSNISYEVEVEFIGSDVEQLNDFFDSIQFIFKILRGTNLLYTNTIKNSMQADIADVLGLSGSKLDKKVLVEARNIKRRDIVWGGIVGNKNTEYVVTFKADGLRKMLIIHSSGIWLVYPPHEFNLVIDVNNTDTKLETLCKNFSGTVLDGELVDLKPNSDVVTKYYYLGFDALSFRGNRGVQSSPYDQRRKIVTAISKSLQNETLALTIKETATLKTPDEFFTTVRVFLDKRKTLKYNEDGLMFIPSSIEYNPHSERYPIKERVLTKHPDTCKWKKPEDITIDFRIKWLLDGKLDIYSYSIEEKKEVPFRGNNINPFTPDMLDHKAELTQGKPSGTVVEYEYSEGMLRPRRIRYDKSGANRLDVALDDWEDIMNPLTEETLTGENLRLTFAYHNKVKRALYSLVPNSASLLDIGGGKGGDVASWARFSRIVTVEPSADNRAVMMNRLKTFDMEDKVTVVPTGGEDTVAITNAVNATGGKVDVISIMLSLSFFWSSTYHLDALVSTIINNLKPGGKIIFLTIDGDAVEQLFEPAFSSSHSDTITIADATIKLYPKNVSPYGRAVDFFLPDTIVGEQREYLVHLADLMSRLQQYGIVAKEVRRAEDEKLLSQSGRLYTSLFSYGYFVNDEPEMLRAPEGPLQNVKLVDYKYPDIVLTSSTQTPKLQIISTPSILLPPLSTIQLPPVPQFNTKISKFQIENTQLAALPVSGASKFNKNPAKGDDVTIPLKCTWYDNVHRISTIGDGNCFVHAVLKALYPKYQENASAAYRMELSERLRLELASLLERENPMFPGYTYWQTAGRGSFPRMTLQEISDESLVEILGVDYSLNGLKALFNSHAQLGDEVYAYIADALNIDIYVLRATKTDLYPHLHTRRPNIKRKGIVIVGNMYHYEVVATKVDNMYQTIFNFEDPFMVALTSRFIGDGDFDDIYNTVAYNPDETFVNDVVAAWVDDTGLKIPGNLPEIFPPNDPFMITLQRLLPTITNIASLRASEMASSS